MPSSPAATFNTKSPTIKRILKEATELSLHPDPALHASPLDTNLFEWHFTLLGPPSTPYANGIYHGRILLPPTYPLRPPSFRFLTPSGRFEVNREICLSISGHHEETWQPAWGIRTALCALRAFMEGGAKGQVGGMDMGEGARKSLAVESRVWRCAGCGGKSNEDILREVEEAVGQKDGPVEQVPSELRMGFRDEMGKAEEAEKNAVIAKSSIPSPESDPPSSTPPQPRETTACTLASHPPPSSSSTSISAQILPPSVQPTMTQPRPNLVQQVSTEDAVPGWIDKAILGLVASLLLMVVRKMAA